jgi:NPCBM/NEW2 domain
MSTIRIGGSRAVRLVTILIAAATVAGCAQSPSSNPPPTTPATTSEAPPPPAYLADLTPIEGIKPVSGPASINGKEYEHSIVQPSYLQTGSVTQAQYNLGRKCDQLTFTAGLTDDSTSNGSVQFEVYGDDKQLVSVRLDFGSESTQTVSITNYLRLRVQNTGIKGTGVLRAGWGNAAIQCRTPVVADGSVAPSTAPSPPTS